MNRAAATVEAFLDDIAANPIDPTPRLIFADWLEDQGLALWPVALRGNNTFAPHGEDHAVSRLRKAIGDGARVYVGDVTNGEADGVTLGMRHGVAAALRCNVETWWRCGPRIVRALPIETLCFTGFAPARLANGSRHIFWSLTLTQLLANEQARRLYGGAHWLPVVWSPVHRATHDSEIFSTDDIALAAASRGALAWAREQNKKAAAG